jgi:ribonuclease HI
MLEEAEKTPIIALDGSVRQNINRGTFAWVLSAADGTPWLKCKQPVGGLHVDSFRAEAYGLLSASMYLNLLAEHFHATIPKVEIHTESESSIKRIVKSRNRQCLTFPNETLSPSWDVHQAIQRELKKLPNLSVHHVQSHQDRATPLDQLSPIARLNITEDELASTAYDSSTFDELVPMAPGVGAHLEINGNTLVSKYRSTSRDIRRTQNIKVWIKEKTGMTDDAFAQVDWQSHTMAVSRSQLQHPFIVKLLHQLLPVGTGIH